MYDALVIIDMQTAALEGRPYNEKAVVENIKKLAAACREKRIPVVYIRHDGGIGDELEKGSDGWQIYKEIAPAAQDIIIDKQYNSAFRKTELKEYLNSIGAKDIIICGMQTEYCIDVSVKVAFEYEYNVTIPRKATTTFDSAFAGGKELSEYYEDKIWNGRYAKVVPAEDIIKDITI